MQIKNRKIAQSGDFSYCTKRHRRASRWGLGIGMKAAEEVGDTEIGEEDEGEIHHAEEVVDYL